MLNITHYEGKHIKITIRYHLTPITRSIIKKSTNTKCWKGCRENGTLLHCLWEYKLIQLLWKTAWIFFKKLEIKLPYDPAVRLIGMYPEEIIIEKTYGPRCIFHHYL